MGNLVSEPPQPSNKALSHGTKHFSCIFKVTRRVIKCCPVPIYTISSLAAVLAHAYSGSDVSKGSEDSGLKASGDWDEWTQANVWLELVLPFSDKQQDRAGIYATVNV